jgi:copper(I)-binding protein
MRIRTAMSRAALVAALFAARAAAACDGLHADGGWLRQPPPGAVSAAGYLVLVNDGDEAVTIQRVSSPAFAGAMMHETRYVEGRAEMRHVGEIVVAPGERVEARPGGLHLMLNKPLEPLTLGDMIEVRFDCARGAPLVTWLPVQRSAPGS